MEVDPADSNVITVTPAGEGKLDARSLSGENVVLGGQSTAVDDVKEVVLSGVAALGQVWSVTLDGDNEFSFLVNEAELPLDSIARSLRDSINAFVDRSVAPLDRTQVYTATLLDQTLIIRKAEGGMLEAVASVDAASVGSRPLEVNSVQAYDSLSLTLSGNVSAGEQWSVMLGGQVFRYTAGRNGESTTVASVDVKIADKDVAGVLVQETLGVTSVIEPSDLVLLGGGQVSRAEANDGAVVSLNLDSDSPAVVVDVAITNSGTQKSQAKATLSGTPAWTEVTIALDENVDAYSIWEIELSRGSEVKTYPVSSAGKDRRGIALELKSKIEADQYRVTIDEGAIRIEDLHATAPGFSARVSRGRAEITNGTEAGWRELNVVLSGTIADGDTVTLKMSSIGDPNALKTYSASYTVFPDLLQIAQELSERINGDRPLGLSQDATARAVTQFVGDFGTSVMGETPTSHDNAFNAQPIDFGMWGTAANPDFFAASIPHLTIKGTGDGAVDFYRFEITDAMAALGQKSVFDIDHGYENFGVYWGSQLRLYKLEESAQGAIEAMFVSESENAKALRPDDVGSSTRFDALLTHTFDEAGTYVIEVLNFLGPEVSPTRSTGLPRGVLYDLNVSIPGHETAEFTFAPAPVLENESLQNAALQTSVSTTASAAQDIDDAASWFTFGDSEIGNETSGNTINSNTPYVTVQGSGNGTYDEYRFTITQQMLKVDASAENLDTISLPDSQAYYRSLSTALLGSVGVGDRWTVTVNGVHSFAYTANSQNADGQMIWPRSPLESSRRSMITSRHRTL